MGIVACQECRRYSKSVGQAAEARRRLLPVCPRLRGSAGALSRSCVGLLRLSVSHHRHSSSTGGCASRVDGGSSESSSATAVPAARLGCGRLQLD